MSAQERLCTRPEYDPEWWSVGLETPVRYNARAVEICRDCPMREACAKEAEALPIFLKRWTIMAGRRWDIPNATCRGCGELPADGRLRADGFCGKPCRVKAMCGTPDGFESHLRWRTIPCEACCTAAGRDRPEFPQRNCSYCGIRYEITGRGKHEYCSKTCWARMQTHLKKMAEKVMAQVPNGKLIEVEYSVGMEVQCRNLGCDNTFVYGARSRRRYCSDKCGRQGRDRYNTKAERQALAL